MGRGSRHRHQKLQESSTAVRRRVWPAALLSSLLLLGSAVAAAPASGNAFGLFEQSARALGVAGAFTAQADDASAVFHNPGGVVFFERRQLSLGATAFQLRGATFEGLDPFPGAGARGEQGSRTLLPAHFYYLQPINERWSFGFGFNSPFGWRTEWRQPAEWPGRFLTQRFEIDTFDLNPTLSWRLGENMGLGFGLVVRFSELSLDRSLAAIDPFTQTVVDVGTVHVDSDLDIGYGATVGFLHRVSSAFAWGISYRSRVRVSYDGQGRFVQTLTGNPELDAAMAGRYPFDRRLPVETVVRYPDLAAVGASFLILPRIVFSFDMKWVGWGQFTGVDVRFPRNPDQEVSNVQEFRNVFLYRFGFRGRLTETTEWRFGFLRDRTPQSGRTVGPFFADANRQGFSVGLGHDGARLRTDLGIIYLPFKSRTTERSRENFQGTFESDAWLAGLTVSW